MSAPPGRPADIITSTGPLPRGRRGGRDPVIAYFCTSDNGADPTMIDTLEVKRQQAEPIEDPTIDAISPLTETDPDKIRKLAADFLRQRGERIPDEAAALADELDQPALW